MCTFDLGKEDHLAPFVCRYMDLATMEGHCAAKRYKCFEQSLADAQIIMHNVIVCFGSE